VADTVTFRCITDLRVPLDGEAIQIDTESMLTKYCFFS
jgi:hypothetical protein